MGIAQIHIFGMALYAWKYQHQYLAMLVAAAGELAVIVVKPFVNLLKDAWDRRLKTKASDYIAESILAWIGRVSIGFTARYKESVRIKFGDVSLLGLPGSNTRLDLDSIFVATKIAPARDFVRPPGLVDPAD